MLKFIITGTGRSGTVYMARVLTDLGIPCGHESIFNHDQEKKIIQRFYGFIPPTISKCSENFGWLDLRSIVADSSYMAVPYLNYEDICDIPIIHVVRNPLSVISSFVQDLGYFCDKKDNEYNKQGWEQWIYSHNSEINISFNPIERACVHWTVWNRRIIEAGRTRPYFLQRVEDEPKGEFFEFIKIPKKEIGFKNKKINSMKKREKDFVPEDIPNGEIKQSFLELMSDFGY